MNRTDVAGPAGLAKALDGLDVVVCGAADVLELPTDSGS